MKYIVLFFLVFFALQAVAQNPYYINYTISDGLPSDNVYSATQHDDGSVWFTTDVGIVRFDSRSFRLFNTDDGLTDNEVFRLSPDSRGRMWMHTLNGKVCFLYRNKIYNERNSTLLRQLKGNGLMTDFYEDAAKNIYISFRSGELFIIDPSNHITRKNIPAAFCGVWMSDKLYAVNAENVLDANTGDTLQPVPFSIADRKVYNNQSRLYHLSDTTYFSFGNRLFIAGKNRLEPYLQVMDLTGITNVRRIDNCLWVTTRDGLYQYRDRMLVNHFFSGDVVTDVLRDTEGNYWITTLNRGVIFVPSMSVLRMLDTKKIYRLAILGDSLWLGGKENNYYTWHNGILQDHYLPADWTQNKISCFRSYKDKIYIGSKSGLVIYNNGHKKYIKGNVNDLLFSHDKVAVATTYTAQMPVEEMEAYIVFTPPKYRKLYKRTNVLCEDDEGALWIGTNFGLYRYKQDADTFSIMNVGEKAEDLSASIEDIHYDKETGQLLVATASKGLVVMKGLSVLQVIKTANGLNNNTVNSIKKIAAATYLAGTNNGLNKVVLYGDSATVDNYNFQVGISNKRVNDIEFSKDTVYLATDYGMLYFHTGMLNHVSVSPACNITTVRTKNGTFTGKPLHYRDNDISVSFGGISFKDRGDVSYYYRITGNDKQWNITQESQVNYKDLAPGHYTFELFCKNGMGNSSRVSTVSFSILPPFWRTPWFIAACIITAVALAYGNMRYRLKKQQRKNEREKKRMQAENERVQMEKQMLELEQKVLRMQMNPHFIFNALNTIKGYYAEGNDRQGGSYIAKFSKLLRMLLNTEGQNTTLDNEIEMLKLYIDLTRIRYHEKFSYEIYVDPMLMPVDIIIPTLLLQPVVENAIIHGLAAKAGPGHLRVSFRKKNEELVCEVQDDGIGRAHAAEMSSSNLHNSKATSIIRDRLHLFDARAGLEITDLEEGGVASGTKVTIILPVKYQSL